MVVGAALTSGPAIAMADSTDDAYLSKLKNLGFSWNSGADADMVDTDELDGVFRVSSHRLEGWGVGSEEDADAGDSDDAAGGRAGPSLIVGDVAGMIPDCTHAGVAVNDWAR